MIEIFTIWKVAFIVSENISENTDGWLNDNAYPMQDTDGDMFYDVRTCFSSLETEHEELKELAEVCKKEKIGFIKLIEQANY